MIVRGHSYLFVNLPVISYGPSIRMRISLLRIFPSLFALIELPVVHLKGYEEVHACRLLGYTLTRDEHLLMRYSKMAALKFISGTLVFS